MRIIGGKYSGRLIKPPANLPVRPTTDFAKTGLFNILNNRFDFAHCNALDLYSGTGSISLELVSRGITNTVAVDLDTQCVSFIKKTILQLEINNLEVVKSDVLKYLKNSSKQFDIVFADPPFNTTNKAELHNLIFERNTLNKNGLFILEHVSNEKYEHLPGFELSRSYGNVTFSFFYNFDNL